MRRVMGSILVLGEESCTDYIGTGRGDCNNFVTISLDLTTLYQSV